MLKAELNNIFKSIKAKNNKMTDNEVEEARRIMGKLRASGMSQEELINMYKQCDQKPKGENEEDSDKEGDLMLHMKQKGMIPKDASTDTGKYGHSREEEEDYTAKDYADEMERKGEGQKIKHKDEEAESSGIPQNKFDDLVRYINKGPVKVKPYNERPGTDKEVHDLAKQDSREENEQEEHCKYAVQGCTCHSCPECKKNSEEEETGTNESQETPRNYEDADVEFNHNGTQYIAFGNGLYNENDDDYDIEDFKVYKRENLNDEVEEEDQNIRNIAYNNLYNKIINMSAEDSPHPSLNDPRNYLPRQ